MVGPFGWRGRNGLACGGDLDEIIKGVEQQAEFALRDRFGVVMPVYFVHMRQQGQLGDKQQQADADNARRRQKSIDRLLHFPRRALPVPKFVRHYPPDAQTWSSAATAIASLGGADR